MIFIIGGRNQGKLDYVLSLKQFTDEDIADCHDCSEDDVARKRVIYNFNIFNIYENRAALY